MDTVDHRTSTSPHRLASPGSGRRNGLDDSIRRELARGEVISTGLKAPLRQLLTTLVEQDFQRPAMTTEDSLLAAMPLFGLFRGARFQRRLEHAIRLGLVRRQRFALRPTVASIAAVRPTSAMGLLQSEQYKLRELRDAEIGRI